jgi:hypothetical protein
MAVITGAALVSAFCAIPFFVRAHAEHAWITLGIDPLASISPATTEGGRLGPISTWAREMGPLAAGLGLSGLVWSLLNRGSRPTAAALGTLVLADAFVPARGQSLLSADPLASVTLLAIGALAVAAVVAVQAAATMLRRARIPLAVPAAVLLVVFHFTLVFAAAEMSSEALEETAGQGADVWTDEVLAALPPSSIVLVRTPAVAWRLWAARAARGTRPDLVVVPLGLIGRGNVASTLVREEPAVAPLIRDVAMTGRVSEFALAGLADARPLYVELDPGWDRRLLEHLLPTPLWLEFTPHTLGRSDRTAALTAEVGRRALHRVVHAAKQEPSGDAATLAVLGGRCREQAVLLAALGDRDSARLVLSDLKHIEPSSEFATKLLEDLNLHAVVDARARLTQ